MQLVNQFRGVCAIDRWRNKTESSITVAAKRPDFLLLMRDTLMFKGEVSIQVLYRAAASVAGCVTGCCG